MRCLAAAECCAAARPCPQARAPSNTGRQPPLEPSCGGRRRLRRGGTGSRASVRPPHASGTRGSPAASHRRLEPVLHVSGDRGVPLPPHGAGKSRVRDLADEHVLERVLNVVRQLARRVATDEVARLELLKRLVDVLDRDDLLQQAAPEGLADDGGRQESGASVLRQNIHARGDRFADRDRQVVAFAELGNRRRKLLEEERIPTGDLDHARDVEVARPPPRQSARRAPRPPAAAGGRAGSWSGPPGRSPRRL